MATTSTNALAKATSYKATVATHAINEIYYIKNKVTGRDLAVYAATG